MKGICKPKSVGVYVVSDEDETISVEAHSNQRWSFEECGDDEIRLHYKSINLYIPRSNFEEVWEIIREGESRQ